MGFSQITLFSETFNETGTSGTSAEGIGWSCTTVCNGTFASNGSYLRVNNPKTPGTWSTDAIDVSNVVEILITVNFEVKGDIEGACNLGSSSCECTPIPNEINPPAGCGTVSSFDYLDFGYTLDNVLTVFPDQLGCSGSGAAISCTNVGCPPSCDVSGGGNHTYYGDCYNYAYNDTDMHNHQGDVNVVGTFAFSSTLNVSNVDELKLVFSMKNNANAEEFRILDVTVVATILPVELEKFRATKEPGKVKLNWTTLSENNNDYFAIERSANGKDFESIGKLNGRGTSYDIHDYIFFDLSPYAGNNYYRLKQYDYDDTFTYSPVVSVNFDETFKIRLYPTLAQSSIHLVFTEETSETSLLYLFDATGRLMQEHQVDSGVTEHEIDIEALTPGTYFLKVQSGRTFETLRFIRQ